MTTLDRILAKPRLDQPDLELLLSLDDPADLRRLYEAAYHVKVRELGKVVHLRGLIDCCSRVRNGTARAGLGGKQGVGTALRRGLRQP